MVWLHETTPPTPNDCSASHYRFAYTRLDGSSQRHEVAISSQPPEGVPPDSIYYRARSSSVSLHLVPTLRIMTRSPVSQLLFLTSVRACDNPGTVTRIFFGSVGVLYRPALLGAGKERLATTVFDSCSLTIPTLPPESSRSELERPRPPSPRDWLSICFLTLSLGSCGGAFAAMTARKSGMDFFKLSRRSIPDARAKEAVEMPSRAEKDTPPPPPLEDAPRPRPGREKFCLPPRVPPEKNGRPLEPLFC